MNSLLRKLHPAAKSARAAESSGLGRPSVLFTGVANREKLPSDGGGKGEGERDDEGGGRGEGGKAELREATVAEIDARRSGERERERAILIISSCRMRCALAPVWLPPLGLE